MASDVLDLDASEPPPTPHVGARSTTLGVKVPAVVAAYVREQAYVEHTTVNGFLRRLIERHRAGDRLPADCREWLVRQAAQTGNVGDPDAALVAVIRHLAARWPNGARLNP